MVWYICALDYLESCLTIVHGKVMKTHYFSKWPTTGLCTESSVILHFSNRPKVLIILTTYCRWSHLSSWSYNWRMDNFAPKLFQNLQYVQTIEASANIEETFFLLFDKDNNCNTQLSLRLSLVYEIFRSWNMLKKYMGWWHFKILFSYSERLWWCT